MQPLWKTVWRFLKELKIELPYDPAIQLLGVYPDKTIIQKDTYTPMFITALFTIAKTWKQPKCPSSDEWIKKMVHIYNGILLSHKKEWNNAICSNMDGPRDYHTTWSKLEKDKYHTILLICRIFLKNDTNELIYKTEIPTDIENKHMVTKGERGRRDKLGVWDWQIHTTIYK